MEDSDVLHENLVVSASEHVLSSGSFKGSEVAGNETVFYEKFLLDDLDNYWDELNDRLTVSRMVNDSIIKGMVDAVVEESTEKIASKEAEIALLREKLESYDNYPFAGSISTTYQSSQKANVRWSCSKDIGRLRLTAEEQLQKLKEDIYNMRVLSGPRSFADVGLCSILPNTRSDKKLTETDERVDSLRTIVGELFKEVNEMFYSTKITLFEQQWEHEFEREINALVIENSMRSLQGEFEKKLYEQRSLINMFKMNWQQKGSELAAIREDLNAVSKSLSCSESGPLFSHNSLDSYDELINSKRKDHFSSKISSNHHLPYAHIEENGITLMKQSEDSEKPILDVADSSQLKHMSRDELASYYISEMIKMRRLHDSALQEKTEELFKLKREYLKERGSSLFKKDKEFELLKRRIPEIILKLDDVLPEKEKLHIVKNDHDELCSLKSRIDTLLSDNQRLRGLLREKRKEIKILSSQISNAASEMSHHLSAEAKNLLHTKKLKEDLEDVKVEASIRNELNGTILKEIVDENKSNAEDLEIKSRIVQDIYTTAFSGIIHDGTSIINSIILKSYNEKSTLQTMLSEKVKALCIETEEKRILKNSVTSLSKQMKEKEKYASETRSTVMQQKEQFDLLNQEIEMLRGQVKKQEILIAKNKVEYYSMKKILDEALQQIRLSEIEVKELNGKLVVALNALEEAENQKSILHGIIKDKENKLLSSSNKEEEQAKQMDFIIASLMELSKASMHFENKIAEKIERNGTRLKILSSQCSPLLQQAHLFGKRAYLYKQMLEIRSSNLQKAEAEVDLLGDEVDALLSLLGKIYIALDHYSPVLQHYPGVMEILKLVQRELEGETAKLV